MMKCPYCSKEMAIGEARVEGETLIRSCNATWFPQEELKKRIRGNYVDLHLNAEGYYCDECMKVIGIFHGK